MDFEGKSNIKKPNQVTMEDYEDEEHHENKNAYNQKEKLKIMEWLKSLHIAIPKFFSLDADTIH